MVNINTVPADQLVSHKRAVPGWFHANITQIKETDKCDALEVHGTILAGKADDPKVDDVVDSVFKVTLYYPDTSKSEASQDLNNSKLTALLLATDLITPAQLGQPINVDEQLAVGRHVLIHLCWARKKDQASGKYVDNPPYVDLAYSDLLHIDDPDGKNVPKNVAALKFVPATLRHPEAYFVFKAKPSSAPPVNTHTAGQQQSAPPAVPGGF